jgi:hypothetical protein
MNKDTVKQLLVAALIYTLASPLVSFLGTAIAIRVATLLGYGV